METGPVGGDKGPVWLGQNCNYVIITSLATPSYIYLEAWYCWSLPLYPSITRPAMGGVVSTVIPLDDASVHRLAELQPRTVT